MDINNIVIETKQLTKKYGNQTVVNQVNLHVKKGRIYGLLGRNGAGKTTIMKMILGLTQVTSGEVELFGQRLKGQEKMIYPRIGAIIETPGFYPNLTGTENLEIFARLRRITASAGEKPAPNFATAAPNPANPAPNFATAAPNPAKPASEAATAAPNPANPAPNAANPTSNPATTPYNPVKSALEVVGLPYKDKKLFGEYSLGMKQRLGIANAILHDPELLILDEPTNGLDPIGIAEVRDFLKKLSAEQGKTILISSHILSEIALLADDIGIIDRGILLEESSMSELQKKNGKYILLQVSDIPKASQLLEQQFNTKDYSIKDGQTIQIYDTTLNMGEINKALVMQDVTVFSSGLRNDTLEDYFKKITGGEGIA